MFKKRTRNTFNVRRHFHKEFDFKHCNYCTIMINTETLLQRIQLYTLQLLYNYDYRVHVKNEQEIPLILDALFTTKNST